MTLSLYPDQTMCKQINEVIEEQSHSQDTNNSESDIIFEKHVHASIFCTHCHTLFKRQNAYDNHKRYCFKKKRKYQCKICSYNTLFHSLFEKHLKKHKIKTHRIVNRKVTVHPTETGILFIYFTFILQQYSKVHLYNFFRHSRNSN